MFESVLILFACIIAYSVKGGWHWPARRYLERFVGIKHDEQGQVIGSLSIGQWILHRVLDGKPLSAVIFGASCAVAGVGFLLPAAMWLLGVAPSIKDPISTVGGIKGNWRDAPRRAGWKEGTIRGAFMGAMLALAFSHTAPILGGALFPVCYWIGVSIQQLRTGEVKASWHFGELIYGAVIGCSLVLAM